MNSKSKGSSFERSISKSLSTWVGSPGSIWRSPGSGSVATSSGYPTNGDLTCLNEKSFELLSAFSFELKFYKNLNWFKIITDSNKIFYNWFDKLNQNITNNPSLIIKTNNNPVYIFFEHDISAIIDISYSFSFYSGAYRIVGYDFERFLQQDYESFIKKFRQMII